MRYRVLAEQIIELKNKDLNLRSLLLQKGLLTDDYHPEMAKIHTENATTLNEIMDTIAYPTRDKVGEEGSEAAWLVIQHSIGQPMFMKKCAQLLAIAVEEEKANPIHLAYLTDRIAVFEGKTQNYGTQFDWDEYGEMSPQAIDDIAKVNQRRKSIGLNSLEEQVKIMRERVKKEKQSPPEDFLKRKQEMENWKRSVGWIP